MHYSASRGKNFLRYFTPVYVCCVTAMPMLLKPPSVFASSDGRYLVVKWPVWLVNITGNGTGPVVSYTLQALQQPGSGDWKNLKTWQQQPFSTTAHHATWFTHLAKG